MDEDAQFRQYGILGLREIPRKEEFDNFLGINDYRSINGSRVYDNPMGVRLTYLNGESARDIDWRFTPATQIKIEVDKSSPSLDDAYREAWRITTRLTSRFPGKLYDCKGDEVIDEEDI